MKRAAILLLVLGVVLAAFVWSGSAPDTGTGPLPDATHSTRPDDPAAQATRLPTDEPSTRTEVATEPAAFTCTNEDGERIEDPVRDGIVIEVRDADGRPLAKAPIGLYWRKGFGLYGWDRGFTEADGTFATTAREVPFFEMVEVQHAELGELVAYSVPLPTANDPRRVVYVVPRTAELRFVVRDLGGAPLAGAKLELRASPEPLALRENALVPGAAEPARTDAEGRLVARLPVGIVDVAASVGEERPALEARVRVPRSGGEADLVLPNPDARHELRITVVRSEEAGELQRIDAWGRSELPRPRSPLVLGLESQQRNYEVHPAGDGTFTAKVDALPFRVGAYSTNRWFAGQEVAANQREVQLVLRPPQPTEDAGPMAVLAVTVTGVGGKPASGCAVRLHLTPDLVQGSDMTTDENGTVELRTPANGATACVSAREYKKPFVFAGPFVLREGRQDVRLQLLQGGTIRVAVVDADGKPAKSYVTLRRPAGPLRAMAEGLPEVLADLAPGDSFGTDEPGLVDFDGIGPGEHEIWAFPEAGGLPAHAMAVAGDQVTLRLGQGCDDVHLLAVHVVDAETGDVLPHAMIDVRPSLYRAVRREHLGPFVVPVRAGKVEIQARAVDHVLQVVEHVAAAGEPEFVLRHEPSPLRFVRLVDANGAGLSGYEIRALRENGTPVEFVDEYGNYDGEVERTDRHGCCVLRGLPRSGCKLLVEKGGDSDGKRPHREFDLPVGAGLEARFELVWK